jgi:cyanobactin maturation PatA/PatG family protease
MGDDRASTGYDPPFAAGSVATIPGLLDLWSETLGDRRVVIAVLDGPVDRAHPALTGTSLETVAIVAPAVPRPDSPATRHGTLVASLIFGRHGSNSPIMGLAPGCRGIVIPIFGDIAVAGTGTGGGRGEVEPGRSFQPTCSQLDLARAILLAAECGAHVINVSAGQYGPVASAHPILADAVAGCIRRGILIVAAAGNDGCECLHIPAALPGVLAVGAMDAHGQPLESSNWGRAYRSGGLLAPGTGLIGAHAGVGTSIVAGTSYAAAIVAGAAGLLLSLALRRGRRLDGSRIREILLDSAEKCLDDSVACRRRLAGRLNLAEAGALLRTRDLRMSDEFPTHPAAATGAPAPRPAAAAAPESVSDNPPLPDVERLRPIVSAAAPASAFAASQTPAVTPSEGCSCPSCRAQAAAGQGGLVFALGQIGYDLISEARRDSIQQHMDGANPNPLDPKQMLDYLKGHDWEAASILWTLNFDQTPIYAIVPAGPFAGKAYEVLRDFLKEQVDGEVERVAIPGRLAGQVRLMYGQVVPVVIPEVRGMSSWTTGALVQAAVGKPPPGSASATQRAAHGRKAQGVHGFLQKVYYELRNLGLTAEERAINYAATNAFEIEKVFEAAIHESRELDSIAVERSPIYRPDSDCWDVKVYFFDPEKSLQAARKVFRFTVDVSDVVPVTVGPMRTWSVR